MPLLDVTAIDILTSSEHGDKSLYGRQRLFGTLAYCSTTAAVGEILERQGIQSILLVVLATSFTAVIPSLLLLPSTIEKKTKGDNEKNIPASTPPTSEVAPLKPKQNNVLALLKKPSFIIFLFLVFVQGVSRHTLQNYLVNYLDDPKQRIMKKSTYGHTSWGMCFAEIVLFFFAKKILAKLGPARMLIVSQLMMVIRVWALYFLPRSENYGYLVFFIEIFKGIGSGLMQSTGVHLAHAAAPRGLEATAQGFFAAVYGGVSAVAGSFIGGLLYESRDSHALISGTAYMSTFGFVIFIFKYEIYDRYFSNNSSK
ncbi:MFS general substrate transporter [Rozella allomycis CSF55]|uniref:MFS general substrate transporter n=1 Tax=Rozella allomycis (strain CSF55) TaxID=988480 RepID=A0A4P9YN88_ROZAC|nr:MFS general substrate transporter [Rozella allomycis CSF55]